MDEYVTKEKVLAQLERSARDPYHESHYIREAVINTIKRMEAADVVEVVRCRDCKYWHGLDYECNRPDWNYYCADGEREDDDARRSNEYE